MLRTGGDHRISNFLLWQLYYSELYFYEDLFLARLPPGAFVRGDYVLSEQGGVLGKTGGTNQSEWC